MDYSKLSFADLYAIKSNAKEKESYYRSIKHVAPEFAEFQQKYADILFHADKELENRLITMKQ